MKQIVLLLLTIFTLKSVSHAQTPGIQSATLLQPFSYYTHGVVTYGMKKVRSGGYLLAGCDTPYFPGYLVSSNFFAKEAVARLFLYKTDTSGKRIWLKSKSSNKNGFYSSVAETSSEDIIAAGYNSFNVTTPTYDIIVSKCSKDGVTKWDKTFGGSNQQYAQGIVEGSDGKYVVAGYTNSNDGDVSGNHFVGRYDFWVIKLDTAGNLIWQKCFGGTGEEKAYAIQSTLDGGYIVAGKDSSSDGDITTYKGSFDGWVIKLDSAGTLQWQKSFGGSGNDVFHAITVNADGTYTLAGYTYSNDGDVTGNHGNADAWVVRIDGAGNLLSQHCYGGTAEDRGYTIEQSPDNAFIVGGYTLSNSGDVSYNNGIIDGWLIKTDTALNLVWEKTMGGSGNDVCMAVAVLSESRFVAPIFTWQPSNSSSQFGFLYKLGNSSSIKGTVYFDKNNNGVKDAGEPPFSNVKINTEKAGYLRTAIPYNGLFKTDVDTGTYSTTALLYNPYYTVTPAVHSSTFSNYFNVDSFSFAVAPIPGKRDVNIHLIPVTNLRPGFAAKYNMLYSNAGTDTVANGSVQFIMNDKLSLDSSHPAYNSISGDTATWNFSDMKPGDSAWIHLYLTVATPPQANIGDTSKSIATIQTPVTDETVNDNTSILKQVLSNSLDPNTKDENHGGKINTFQITNGDYLLYTINFQNTGTDTASNIIVRDTLNDKLDWSTLQMITSSHDFQMNIKDGNKIAWSFTNIKLIDSSHNEPASHGYIVYRVKPKASVALGDTIKNTASIYFDFNLPVATNTQTTLVENEVLPIHLLTFTARKNGSKNKLEWKVTHSTDVRNFVIERSTDGKHFSAIENIKADNNTSYTTYDNAPVRGINYYRLQMTAKDGKKDYSPVKSIDNSMSFSTTIFPNPVKNILSLSINSEKSKNIRISIASSEGKNIAAYNRTVLEGLSNIQVPVSALAKGYYVVFIVSENEQSAITFEKL